MPLMLKFALVCSILSFVSGVAVCVMIIREDKKLSLAEFVSVLVFLPIGGSWLVLFCT
jgi:hypothetical protein